MNSQAAVALAGQVGFQAIVSLALCGGQLEWRYCRLKAELHISRVLVNEAEKSKLNLFFPKSLLHVTY